MSERASYRQAPLSEALFLQRLARFEDMREFFIQAWLQNPALARQAGERVRAMLAPMSASSRDGAALAP
jgi:hypothetical protein